MFLDDVGSVILQYLNPNEIEIVHFKLVCSHYKGMVERVVPLHHIISIFQSILNNEPYIPSLVLPSDYKLTPSHFSSYFSILDSKMQQEHVVHHLVTKFIILFHNNPLCIQFLTLFHNSQLLFQLAKKDAFLDAPLFQKLRHLLATRSFSNGL